LLARKRDRKGEKAASGGGKTGKGVARDVVPVGKKGGNVTGFVTTKKKPTFLRTDEERHRIYA